MDNEKKAIIQKIGLESDIIELKMQSYQNILNKEYNKSLNCYEDYLDLAENCQDNYIKSDAFYSYGMSNYLNGEFEEALKYLEFAHEKIEALPKIKKNKILELKIICNLCLINLSLSNFNNSIDYCNLIVEIIRTETDKKYQKEALKQVMQIFFNTDSLNNFFTSNINRYNLNERILINNDNKNNEEFRIKITSKIIYFFHKYLRDDDIDSWIQCLNEECENFKIINESNGFLIGVFNMYLSMYTKNPNITEKAKMKIFNICKCLINSKDEKDIKPLESLLKESREKMRQATLIYKKLQNIEVEIDTLNTSSSGFLKRKSTIIDQSRGNSNVITKIFLCHAKNYLMDLKDEGKLNGIPFKFDQMLNQIDISLDLIKNNKIDLADLNVLDFDIDLAVAMKAMFENLLFIRYKFIVEKYFRKLMRLTFGYENLKSKLLKKQKRFEAFSTRKYLDICEGKKYIIL